MHPNDPAKPAPAPAPAASYDFTQLEPIIANLKDAEEALPASSQDRADIVNAYNLVNGVYQRNS